MGRPCGTEVRGHAQATLFLFPSTSILPCQYHSTNYVFIYLPVCAHNVISVGDSFAE
jgi:hypothetical protein